VVFLLVGAVEHPIVFVLSEVIFFIVLLRQLREGLHAALVETTVTVRQLTLDPFGLLHAGMQGIVFGAQLLQILLGVLFTQLPHLPFLLQLLLLLLAALFQGRLLVDLELL